MRRPGLALVLLVLALTGCTAGSGASDSADAGSAAFAEEDRAAGGAGDLADDGGEAAAVADIDSDRQVVTEGSVTLTVERPRIAARDAASIVEASGGHVQERVEQAGEEPDDATAWLVVRVPSDGLTQVLAELERLGGVDSIELTSNDVTAQAQDLDARIRALEISVARLEDLLSRAQSTADVVAAEGTLTERQSELESLQSQRDRLADRVEMSTVRLLFQTEEGAPAPVRAGFGGGLETGWESLGAALSVGLLVLGVLLPWLVVVGAVVGVAVLARREVRRRRAGAPPAEVAGPSST